MRRFAAVYILLAFLCAHTALATPTPQQRKSHENAFGKQRTTVKPVTRSTAKRAFSMLLKKAGDWKLKNGGVRVTLEPVASDSVLLERWTTPSGKVSLTVYHLDGDRLLATHYCPQGNQPRLALTSANEGVLHFTFADGTNLKPGASRMHALTIDATGNAFIKTETYRDDKEAETTTMVFERTAE